MSDVVVKVDGLYKKFCRTLKLSMFYGLIDVLKSTIGIPCKQSKLRKNEFWALNNISFELKRGETLGVIGVNGCGKTTLLRLITGIFPPDKGKIYIKGRVGSLIAIGAGFHPHMTGRENIFLNGTILGMSKKEINKKLSDIIDFADIGDFLDAPISTYSSGMRVRLGFSIAIHCEPDVLLVDEVLAVGDINFQKKATEKIFDLRKKASTIFVSHSMRHVYRICDKAILLDKGKIEKIGKVDDVVTYYLNKNIKNNPVTHRIKLLEKSKIINNFEVILLNKNGEKVSSFNYSDTIKIKINIESKEDVKNVLCSISILSPSGDIVTVINTDKYNFDLNKGKNTLFCIIKKNLLIPSVYILKVKISLKFGGLLAEIECGSFDILEIPGYNRPRYGSYREEAEWEVK